ncbi:hypothetical protein [Vermiculatibacterium agrestimuris]|uniref:hypothetical protein n=1 Tax=Vermiculatibacterium agrestimuris TaxID=2941519 RepID=UPI00203EBDFF|nr:hypothetical protein [Vermiculatibacterium agrestimuris]
MTNPYTQFVTEDGRVFQRVQFLTVDGEEFVELGEDYYQYLLEQVELSRNVRYRGVEEFRLWCQVNKGTITVEEGLRACTAKELYDRAVDVYLLQNNGWTTALNLVYEAMIRLERRAEAAQRAREEVAPKTIMPPEGEGDNADHG